MADKVKKKRLDVYLYENGIVSSREKARILIMEGKVYVNNQKEDKPGTMIKEDAKVEIKGETLKYVSRGGLKLEKAGEVFNISFEGKCSADIGSSTGGFTDYMLQNGAKRVYAIDSGTNQLDYKLRVDERVVTLENTNARYLTRDMIDDVPLDIVTIDVSFISLKKIIPPAIKILKDNGTIMMLIKPQFEAGRDKVEKNGVVRDKTIHADVIKDVVSFCISQNLTCLGLDYSPIKGPAGNIEFLLYVSKSADDANCNILIDESYIKKVVDDAHDVLN